MTDGQITSVIASKDMYSAEMCEQADARHSILRPQGLFHVCTWHGTVSPDVAISYVDAWLAGHTVTIDLNDYKWESMYTVRNKYGKMVKR